MTGIINSILHPLAWLERRVIFAPEKSFRGTPEHVGLQYEDVFPVTSDGVRIHGWYLPGRSVAEGGPSFSWLIFHGNGGNISVRLDQYRELHHRYGASILAIDYRGYGRSDGTPSEEGLYRDAAAAYGYLSNREPNKKVVVFGRSMGGAVAAQVASVTTPAALVLEASISSVPEVMREHAPWTRYSPVRLIIRSGFDTKKHVRAIDDSVPKILFHGDSDQTVSFRNSERIFESAPEPKELHVIENGDHDYLDLVDPERYHDLLSAFLREAKLL